MASAALKEHGSSKAATEPFLATIITDVGFVIELVGLPYIREKASGLLRVTSGFHKEGFDMPAPGDAKKQRPIPGLAALREMPGGAGPSASALKTMRKVRTAAAEAVLTFSQKTRVPDGRSLSQIRYSDLAGLGREGRVMANFSKMLIYHGIPADPSILLPDFVTETKLEETYQRAVEFADAI